MASLFGATGDDLDPGYLNLQSRESETERRIVETLEDMWVKYEPFADLNFVQEFARQPDSRFWEMALACSLLDAGKHLVPASERRRAEGGPDICALDGDRKLWIEAIAPDRGDRDEDGVPDFVPINEGGRVHAQPVRQIQLRITSALLTKSRVLKRYLEQGIIAASDARLIAVSACKFGIYTESPGFPLALSAVFPIGNEFVRVNADNCEVVEHGFHPSCAIDREQGDDIPRTAFLHNQFAHVSGLIWSRVGIGNMNRAKRPLSLIHNPLATTPVWQRWGVWDREFVATAVGDYWTATDILANAEADYGATSNERNGPTT